jgi:hypothetical protein
MRNLICCLALLGLATGCDDDTGGAPTVDMSAAAGSCAAIEACSNACPAPVTQGTCVPGCIAAGNATGKQYFTALAACSGPACTAVDGGTGPCVDPKAAACTACVQANCAAQLTACLAH